MENKPQPKKGGSKYVYLIVSVLAVLGLAVTLFYVRPSISRQESLGDKTTLCIYNTNPEGWLDGELKPAIENCQYESECNYIHYPSYTTIEEAQDECHAYFARLNSSKKSCDKIIKKEMREKCYKTITKN